MLEDKKIPNTKVILNNTKLPASNLQLPTTTNKSIPLLLTQ